MNIDSVSFQQPSAQISAKSFAIRAAAFIIDAAAAYLENLGVNLILAAIFAFYFLSSGQTFQPDQFSTNKLLEIVVSVCTSLIYFVLFEGLYGATPGKLILGMRVVKEDGASCDFITAFIRGVLRLVDGFLFGVPAYFTMKPPLFQRIGDKSAKTMVVSAKDPIIKEHIDWWWFAIAAAVFTTIDFVVTLFLLMAAMP